MTKEQIINYLKTHKEKLCSAWECIREIDLKDTLQ